MVPHLIYTEIMAPLKGHTTSTCTCICLRCCVTPWLLKHFGNINVCLTYFDTILARMPTSRSH